MPRPLVPPSSSAAWRLLAALACALALAVAATAAAGCGSGEEESGGEVAGTRLHVYSSMPLAGPDGAAGLDVVRAERMALADAGGRAGRYEISLRSLDSVEPEEEPAEPDEEELVRDGPPYDPERISENARRAAEDPDAIAYLGEFRAGSSAVSIPRLNEAGILQVSPLDGALALTQRNAAVPGAPGKYFPRGEEIGPTFSRLVPTDRVEARAQLAWMERRGVQRLVVLGDEDPASAAYAVVLRAEARRHGIAVVGREDVDPHEQDPRELVDLILGLRPDAVFYGGGVHEGLVRLWQDLAVADPGLGLFVPGSVADDRFLRGVGSAGGATFVTRPVLDPAAQPAAAQRFVRRFEAEHGTAPAPEAIYGYEAMRAVLAAVERAAAEAGERPLERADVVRAFRSTRREGTVLGDYAVAGGDTSLRRIGGYRVEGGQLRWMRALVG